MIVVDKKRKIKLALRIIALTGFIGAVIYLSVRYTPQIADLFARRRELKQHVEAKGPAGIVIFIFFQILQVVVAAVPGEIVQVAGGYFYGTFWGTVYLVIGVIIGSVVNFFAARRLGWEIVKILAPDKWLENMYQLVRGPKMELVMFVFFLLPGLPKDVLTYLAGLTPIRPVRFLAVAVTARLPALIASTYIGAGFQRENLTAAVTTSAVALVFLVMGLLVKDKVIAAIRK